MKSLLLSLCLISFAAYSQRAYDAMLPETPTSKWEIIHVDVLGGMRKYGSWGNKLGLQNFVKNPSDLVNSGSNFYPSTWFFQREGTASNFAVNLGFTTGRKQQEVRFGLNYSQYSTLWSQRVIDGNISVKDSFEVIYPNQAPATVYLDSVWVDQERLLFTQQFVFVSGEYIFQTERNRVSGYAGFGAQFGVSIQQDIDYSRYETYNYQYSDSNGNQVFQHTGIWPHAPYGAYTDVFYLEGEGRSIKAKTAFMLAPYVPIGVEYTPFLKRHFLRRFSVEAKGIIGLELHMLKQAPIEMKPFYSFNFGIKYFIRKTLPSLE